MSWKRRRDGPPKRRAARFTRGNRRRRAWSRPSTRSTPSAKPAPPSSSRKSMKAGRLHRSAGRPAIIIERRRQRPALKRLIADIESGQIDVVVVYKVDRLTRALSDFARLVDVFDRRGVSFVSITQQFNTTTSMGRLTLNVLLSFAQFEREVIGERVRDKIAASKKKGMWMGGMPPLGYDVNNRKLVVNEDEARTVVDIYRRYLALKSVHALREELAEVGIRSKRRMRPRRTCRRK